MRLDVIENQAADYVSGSLTASQQEAFEVLLEFHPDLQTLVAGMQRVAATMTMSKVTPIAPPANLRRRILNALDTLARPPVEGKVVTDAGGLIEWVNPAFTLMCGYSLDELRGRKPGHVLQGPETDPATVERIRSAVRARLECREAIVNYHRNGTPYRVEVRITPIIDDEGEPLWFVAKERELRSTEAMPVR